MRLRVVAFLTLASHFGLLASFVMAQTGSDHPDPTQLEFQCWSGELNVPDPVAISFDSRGTAYVTQTLRRKAQDLDIRANRDWIADDVGFESVADKRNFYHLKLAPGKDQEANRNRVEDLNNDGSHDWKDLTVISEKIHWVADSNQDGTADAMGVFAEGFQTEVTGIAAGVLWHNGDIYTTIAPDVWKLTDTDNDHVADQRSIIATGFGFHIAYAGHDLHGLTVGPDGKLYWSVGDKGVSVKSREGKRFFYPNQGCVMRSDFDGGNFEVFAHGLRNVQELAFDDFGNLFGVDNDADKQGERERFVYIVRDSDAGWRCNYQYRGGKYDPWMDESLWIPHFDGQASYIVPPICHSIDGPAGFAFNPGTALSSDYRSHFFLTGAPGGHQYAFRTRREGASFSMVGEHEIGRGTALVGINFGPDGGLYGVDWAGGYPLNQTGAIYKLDAPQSDLLRERAEVRAQLADGFNSLATNELIDLLAHADQRLRLGAQFELVSRREVDAFRRSLESKSEMATIHSIWGLGQLARAGDASSKDWLIQMLQSPSIEFASQAARTLADVDDIDGNIFLPLLDSSDERLLFMTCQALSYHPVPAATSRLLEISDQLAESKRYLRFAVSRALAACASGQELVAASKTLSKVGRLNTVVALRTQGQRNLLSLFLADIDAQVATEAARAIHDDICSLDDLHDLAASLSTTKHNDQAFVRRALNANFRLGGPAALQRIVSFATQSGREVKLRIEAIDMLRDWREPDVLDRVDGRRRTVSEDRSFDVATLGEPLSQLSVDQDSGIQTAAIRAARSLKIALAPANLFAIVADKDVSTDLRVESLRSLANQKASELSVAIENSLHDSKLSMRQTAGEILVELDPARAEAHFISLLDQSRDIAERQHAISQLAQMNSERSEQEIIRRLRQIPSGEIAQELWLEIFEAGQKRLVNETRESGGENNEWVQALGDATAVLDSIEDSLPTHLAKFRLSRNGGNSKAGEELFNKHLAAQCVRCHRIQNEGSDVGPDLRNIATKRDRDYLLRSIVAPSADIDPQYQSHSVLMTSGRIVQGILKSETPSELVIIDSRREEIHLDQSEVEDVLKNSVSIMPDMTETLTPREVRDLLEFLTTLK